LPTVLQFNLTVHTIPRDLANPRSVELIPGPFCTRRGRRDWLLHQLPWPL
jgi:hypothetical protein